MSNQQIFKKKIMITSVPPCSKNPPTIHGLRDFSWGLQELLDFSFKFLVDYHAAVLVVFVPLVLLDRHHFHGVDECLCRFEPYGEHVVVNIIAYFPFIL